MCISRRVFFFWLMTLLAVYFIFILDYGNDARQKANSNNFLICIQNGSWSSETTRNIHNVFVPGTTNEPTVQWWFRKFCKGDESLEDEECNGQSSEVDNDQLKAHWSWSCYNCMRSCQRTHPFYGQWNLKQTGKMKNLGKWVPSELTKTQNIIVLKCCLILFYATTMNCFFIRLWGVMKSGFYTIICDDQLSGWTKKKLQSTSQSQTCTKNQTKQILVIVWWSAANLIHCNFLNSGNTITSKKYDQEIGDATKTAKNYSQQWSTERAQFFKTTPQCKA